MPPPNLDAYDGFARTILAELDGVRPTEEIAKSLDERGQGHVTTLASARRILGKLARDGVVERVANGVWRVCDEAKQPTPKVRRDPVEKWVRDGHRLFGYVQMSAARDRLVESLRKDDDGSDELATRLCAVEMRKTKRESSLRKRDITDIFTPAEIDLILVICENPDGLTKREIAAEVSARSNIYSRMKSVETKASALGFEDGSLIRRECHPGVYLAPTFYHPGKRMADLVAIIAEVDDV